MALRNLKLYPTGMRLHEWIALEGNYWADEGATSFKAYQQITRAELAAAIAAAHQRGLKLTGHLCAAGFREAIALGVDTLEDGVVTDTEFTPGKRPDMCPPNQTVSDAVAELDIAGRPVRDLIEDSSASCCADLNPSGF